MFKESILMSWSNIIHNRMRSFLTILGIIIGIMAIIALVTIVSSVTSSLMSQFSALGTNTLTVQTQGTVLKQGLTNDEFLSLNEVDGVAGLSPSVGTNADVVINGEVIEKASIEGKNERYFQRNGESLIQGRGINALDVANKNTVCVINKTFMDEHLTAGNALGTQIVINGVHYAVVGVAEDSSSVMSSMSGGGASVMLPYKNVLAMNGTARITSFEVYVNDGADIDKVIGNLEVALDGMFNNKDDVYSIINMQSMIDLMSTMESMLTAMLGGIASIALLVGGIGIMNMMLVSVTERTTEIGLRKALGARPRNIQLQFIIEALFLSLIGGIIGIILGILVSLGATLLLDIVFEISWFAIGLGAGFSIIVGLVFGWAPALKASRLNPIDALRSN